MYSFFFLRNIHIKNGVKFFFLNWYFETPVKKAPDNRDPTVLYIIYQRFHSCYK